MTDLCASIVNNIGQLFTCASVGEYTRVRTPFMYPDGDYIDIFVRATEAGFVATDLAETGRWLRMQTVTSHRSPKQRTFIEDACITHGVEWYRGMITTRASSRDEVSTAILRVAQASLRISDLWFTLRQRLSESIIEEVSSLLSESKIQFDRGEKLVGRSQKSWRLDFHTRGLQRSNLIEVLSTGNRAAGQSMIKHIVTLWHDLSHLKLGHERIGFITLFDDTIDVWSSDDYRLIDDLSDIAYWSRPEEFLEKIAA
jgi:hypothetical protein